MTQYEVHEQFDGYDLTFTLSLPSALPNLDIATVRVDRDGGATPADQQFRNELFTRIGAVTAAAAAVETGMKRLLLLLAGESGSFSRVDLTWTDLHKGLVDACTGADDRRLALADVLAWGDENNVKGRRDDVVHAYWWLFAGCGVRRSRFKRKSDGTTLVTSFEQLDEDAEILFDYAGRLDELLGSDWGWVALPRLP